jgi:selenide,water dikinase
LAQVLRRIPSVRDRNLLVGASTADDAGVYRLPGRRNGDSALALVQTVDFFTPVVDDPYAYGQIAAANALSDVYAMGGRPLTALNLLAVPPDRVPPDSIAQILRGGAAKAKEARCAIVGGHTIRNPEPIYGLAVTGLVHPKRIITNANARPGDLLVLTKPLGTGVVTTGIKRGLTGAALAKRAVTVMAKLNAVGAELAELRRSTGAARQARQLHNLLARHRTPPPFRKGLSHEGARRNTKERRSTNGEGSCGAGTLVPVI